MTEGRTYYADCRYIGRIKLDRGESWNGVDYARCDKWIECSECGFRQGKKHPDLHQDGCLDHCPDFEKVERRLGTNE